MGYIAQIPWPSWRSDVRPVVSGKNPRHAMHTGRRNSSLWVTMRLDDILSDINSRNSYKDYLYAFGSNGEAVNPQELSLHEDIYQVMNNLSQEEGKVVFRR